MKNLRLPWVLGDRRGEDYETSPTGSFQDIDAGGHAGAITVVVRMSDDDVDYPAGLAAVRLILAAPALLEAAKSVLNGSLLDEVGNRNDDGLEDFGRHRTVDERELKKWSELLRSAIKQAEVA